ncbi:MAG: methyltransferase domain-containing protein [Lachnospiraceae bacterium]|nr:methyltransferase domain-containing protein [Lachnospiraceae bacterium]
MDIILYGAGKKGKKVEGLLFSKGIAIKGFYDSNKKGQVECESGRIYPIVSEAELLGEDVCVIVTIATYSDSAEIAEWLSKNNVAMTSVEKLIKNTGDIVADNRAYIADYHVDKMDDYFERAEKESSLSIFWNKDSVFYGMFCKLDLDNVVELACGRGRHVPRYIEKSGRITLVDILDKNIEYCKERFRDEKNIVYYKNNGYDLQDLQSGVYTSLFTYDAMVHFEMLDIFNYLKETERILVGGGKALFHHSNNTEDYKITFSSATRGRNYMSRDLFAHLVNRAGMRVVKQEVFDWGGSKELDCLTLVEKPEN